MRHNVMIDQLTHNHSVPESLLETLSTPRGCSQGVIKRLYLGVSRGNRRLAT